MRVWRLARAAYAVLDGEGARRYGGRWNEPGTAVVYASAHLSLAALEVLVHLDVDLVPGDLTAYEIEVPEGLDLEEVSTSQLPDGWDRAARSTACRAFGEQWVQERRGAVLLVPSAVVPEERNVLLNPAHPEAAGIRVVRSRPFVFDARLLRR